MAQAPVPLSHGKYDKLDPVARLNGRVFDNDPVIAYMLLDMSHEQRLQYLPSYWSKLARSALMNDALITEADGWKAASIVIPPGRDIDNVWTLVYSGFLCILWKIGYSGLKRLWTEFSGMTDNAKRKGLGGQKRYYYVFSIGTEYEHRGKGLAKAIMHYHQEKARAENLPIWLEATTETSRLLYLSMGFQEIEKLYLGKGKVAADATIQPGGPGITLYAMVWWPKPSNLGSGPEQAAETKSK
ncbi:Acyl-CoA N-acyltransferase [Penicillium atrosanguineum]|uniref:Acyl-CoA N-acyltransferase n=1 Tax=Penicillium atrosanguineum TaxID=1132637 RepID=A0A9W9GXW8_9EURO|nr:uncharacterized protein N7443_009994 [Penicillium atrosanguineum]KAJ5132074.1 Acyl-CoA N-acyltransferase [Penicillium atrosanguineum]KAJ5137716.1 Acyl-CoA N-acyltransferase [Penicillium atrosanguineum]KAJ5289741.1 hypothetical protein N7443_009994 [Penicillium atrosanguineum]KAJ5307562.1 Acyl-CoA N-acyltransferase [Penicillium atrosanguineum]